MADDKAKHPEETEPSPEEWLALLRRDVKEFNQFRDRHPLLPPRFPEKADFHEVSLKDAFLYEAHFKRADLRGICLAGAALSFADLSGADLRGANLENAEIDYANLEGADLRGANVQRASLAGANLRRACFLGADLRGADLEVSQLKGAELFHAQLQGADLRGVKGYEEAESLSDAFLDSKTRFSGVDTSRMRPKYPLLARFIDDTQFVEAFRTQHPRLAWVWWLTCDYGRSWMRWASWALGMALFFGILFTLFAASFELRAGRDATWFTYFYFSIVTFTTLGFGDVVPKNWPGEVLLSFEVVLGYVMLGGLVSILATKLARRS